MLEVPATWRSLTKIRIRELPDIGAKAARGARVQAGGELGGSNKKALALGEKSEGTEGMRTKFICVCGPLRLGRGKPEPFSKAEAEWKQSGCPPNGEWGGFQAGAAFLVSGCPWIHLPIGQGPVSFVAHVKADGNRERQ